MAMDNILKRARSVIDFLNLLVLSPLDIHHPPGNLHLRSRLRLFQPGNAMDRMVTWGKRVGFIAGGSLPIILGHVDFLNNFAGAFIARGAAT